ncbi:MAG: transcriptional regulator NrdR [Planctomycetota bacterium]
MRCPFCKSEEDKVVDSRSSAGGSVIRRRRRCKNCKRRFTTYERVERSPLRVIKKDGRRVDFDRGNILQGLQKACHKRPVATDKIDETVAEIEREIYETYEREVPTSVIGEKVIAALRKLDDVAYVRFASVYREFKDVTEFLSEIQQIKK